MFAGGVYGGSVRESDDHKNLVVILSQSSKPIIGSTIFPCRALDVWENRKTTYYTYRSDIAVKELASLADGVRNVVFIGCSKGGYGALLWGLLYAAKNQNVKVSVIAFSPQTELYPNNSNIKFPSYLGLIDRANSNEKIAAWLKKRGRLPKPTQNFHADIYYPEMQANDRDEALRLSGLNAVALHPLALSCHTTILPFTSNMTARNVAEKRVLSLFDSAKSEPDLSSYLHQIGFDTLVSEYMALGALPTVSELVSSIIQRPRPRLESRIESLLRKIGL